VNYEFVQVNAGPLNPKSTKVALCSKSLKDLLLLFRFTTLSYLSVRVDTTLKFPIQQSGKCPCA
jgi:hypothetical protein